jgi:hypothetical protein
MTFYDQIRSKYENSSPEEKLTVIRGEIIDLYAIMGNAHLLGYLGKADPSGLPHEYVKWCEEIYDAGQKLIDLIEGLTDTQENNRKSRSDTQMANGKAHSTQSWQLAQEQLSELREFSDFWDAILKTTERIGLNLSDQIRDNITPDSGNHISIYMEPGENEMGITIDAGYLITLQKFHNKIIRWKNFKGKVSSITDVCQIIIWWITDNRSIDDIRVQYPQFISYTDE